MRATSPSISIIIPVMNESESLDELHERLSLVLADVAERYEIIFVDDGSTDGSYQKITRIMAADHSVRSIKFRRNFGKSAALAAGFSAARYDVIITMDADLQDLPEHIPLFLAKIEEGYDLVSGWRYDRQDPLNKRISSKLYNWTTALLTGVHLHDINCGFKCYRREVLDEVLIYGERHRFTPVLASYRGFRIGEIKIEHAARRHGSSHYGVGRVFGGVFSLLTVILMTRYTNRPLHFFGVMGLMLSGLGTCIDIYLFYQRIFYLQWLTNRPLLIIGTLFIIIGVQFILFGLLAEMIAFSYRREDDYSIVTADEDETRAEAVVKRRGEESPTR